MMRTALSSLFLLALALASPTAFAIDCTPLLVDALVNLKDSVKKARARSHLDEAGTAELRGHSYKESSVFERGEYVSLRDPLDQPSIAFPKHRHSGRLLMSKSMLPVVVKFLGVHETGQYVVELRHSDAIIEPTKIVVPMENIAPLASGTHVNLKKHLETLDAITLTFEPGENIRYRGSDGRMQTGKYSGQRPGGTVFVTNARGKHGKVPADHVFKSAPATGRVFTANFDSGQRMQITRPEGAFAEVLNGAARIQSHPDFAALPVREKLLLLTQYVQTMVPWQNAGKMLESAGIRDMSEMVCAGVGVCRHLGLLLAVITAEAGYHTRVARHSEPGKSGHLWVEVDWYEADGTVKTYVLDPSTENIELADIITLQEAQASDRDFAKRFYANPERELVGGEAL